MTRITYNTELVAYLDILGYKSIVEGVTNNKRKAVNKIRRIREILAHVNEIVDPRGLNFAIEDSTDLKVKIFSDSICISGDCMIDRRLTPTVLRSGINPASYIGWFLLTLIYIQAELFLEDIRIRGAVVAARHYQDDMIIFSKGLIDAYYLEQSNAIYPRVVISESVVDLLEKYTHEQDRGDFTDLIKRDSDGIYFLNYLIYTGELDNIDDELEFVMKHKEITERCLRVYVEPRVKEKYVWIARYHNETFPRVTDITGNVSLLIDENLWRTGAIFSPVCCFLRFDNLGEIRDIFFYTEARTLGEAVEAVCNKYPVETEVSSLASDSFWFVKGAVGDEEIENCINKIIALGFRVAEVLR